MNHCLKLFSIAMAIGGLVSCSTAETAEATQNFAGIPFGATACPVASAATL